MPIYTFRMDATTEVHADSLEEAWAELAMVPDNAWDLDFPEHIDTQEDSDE